MNLILSRTLLLLLLLVLCCNCTPFRKRKNIVSRINEKPAVRQNQITKIVPIPATTPVIPTISEPNHTKIAVLVVKWSLRFSLSDICGGILVSPRIVITAAHCFYDTYGLYRRYPNMFRVVHGQADVYQKSEMMAPPADLMVAHPDYRDNGRINDIGAIRLKNRLEEGSSVLTGQLLPFRRNWNDKAQLEMLVFSIEDEKLHIARAKRMAARFISKYKCEDVYRRWGVHITSKQLCIEPIDTEFYHCGESAILLLNDQPIAVLSFKLDVTSRLNILPYIYTDLSSYSNFIRKEIHTDAALRLKPFRVCSSILYVVISRGLLSKGV